MRRAGLAALGLVLVARASSAADAPGGAAAAVEREFADAIKTVTPATVFCVASGRLGASSGSSGVIVTSDGYVLSDSDAGAYFRPELDASRKPIANAKPVKEWADDVEVRVPDATRGSYVVYTAKVVRRERDVDSALLKIQNPPPGGFRKVVVPRTSADLDVGQFTFAVGTSFPSGESAATSSLTAGIVAALVPLPVGAAGGRWAEIYTSAAINPGVNGGPLVDADGSLVGMISTWVEVGESDPFQLLGKAFPIDRIRAAYRQLPVHSKVFPDAKAVPVRAKETALLETAIGAIAKQTTASVVSLTLTRAEPLRMLPATPNARVLGRYGGPTSGIVVSRDGWIVASLYAFVDIGSIADVPSFVRTDISADLAKITAVTARFADGTTAPARIVARDERWGLVCLKATLPPDYEARPPEPAPKDELRQGRLVVGVANPFGSREMPLPLVTLGILSRVHPDDSSKPWAGQFQTDANMTDGTVGGALVDVQGRLLGMATLWNPAMQGRNSGIGFGVPWHRIEAALPALRAGTTFRFGLGYMGVGAAAAVRDTGGAPIGHVEPESPAAKAGFKVGDRITSIEGKPVDDFGDLQPVLRSRLPGDRVKVTVDRDGKALELEVVLGEWPSPNAAPAPAPRPQAPPAMDDTPAMGR